MCTPTQGVWQPAGCVSCELVCVCVSLVRVVIICPASTHTALVSSPSLAVLHLSTYLPSLLGEKGEAGAISRPSGALPLSAVGEAGERIFGEDGAVITAALTGFERLCERLWERACVGVVPPLPPVECKLQFLGVEVPDAVNLPCALSKVEGLFPLGPSLGGSGLARCILLCV